MTEDSPSVMRGYGPFEEGTEPTAPLSAQPTGADQPDPAAGGPIGGSSGSVSGQPVSGRPPAARSAAGDEQGAAAPQQTTDVTPSAQNGETPPTATLPIPAQPAYDEYGLPEPTHGQYGLPQPTYDQYGLPQPIHGQHGAAQSAYDSQGPAQSAYDPQGSAQPAHDLQGAAQSAYDPQGPAQSAYDPQSTTPYPPQPTTPYPAAPTGMLPYTADPQATYPITQASATPASGAPSSGPPASGPPTSAYPASGAPTSAYPASGAPTSASPASGAPASGAPYAPTSGSPYPTSGGASPAYGPFRPTGTPTPPLTTNTPDPYDFTSPTPFTSRRIEPSPPPDRSRLLIGLIAGLVAGLLVFGTAGWFGGRATAPKAAPTAAPTPTPTVSLGLFEQSQVALNQPHFAATGLVAISQGWLPYLSACSRSGEPGGPTLNAGEKTRVRCTLDGMSAIFVEYNSVAARDKARVTTLGQNVDARTLTPGVGPAVQRSTPSGRTSGNYVEYAYKLTEGGVTRPVAGIWWDDAQTPVAGYLLAYWKEGLGESWDPMRDLWARYA